MSSLRRDAARSERYGLKALTSVWLCGLQVGLFRAGISCWKRRGGVAALMGDPRQQQCGSDNRLQGESPVACCR